MHKEQAQYAISSLANIWINDLKTPVIGQDIHSILVLKTDEIGDMMYCLHVLEECTKHLDPKNIHVYCKSMNRVLVQHISPKIQVHTARLPRGRFDLVLDLRSSTKIMVQAMFKSRYRLDRGTVRLANKLKGAQTHEVYTNWNVLKPVLPKTSKFHFPEIRLTHEEIQSSLDKFQLKQPYFIVHAGARDASRRWPTGRFVQAINHIHKKTNWKPILVGGPSDLEVTQTLSRELSTLEHSNLANKTDLIELAKLCAKAEFFLGNESGPLHFANVMKTPLLALFGPGVRDVFYPYHKNSAVLHPTKKDNPILAISVEDVIQKFNLLFETR